MAREKGMGNLQLEKSGRWTMRIGIDGKRFSRSTYTTDREQAERILQRYLAPLGLGERHLPLADVWREYVKSPLRNELSPATLNAKRIVWMHFAEWMEKNFPPVKELASVTPDVIAEYLSCMRERIAATTYNGRICILREIFRILAEKGGVERDPWAGVRLRPEDCHSRRALSVSEVKQVLAAAKKQGDDWHVLFLIAIYTGQRLGDCCNLDWSAINLQAGVIQLIPRKTRRHLHGQPTTIPIHPKLGQALVQCLAGAAGCRTGLTGPVLPSVAELYDESRWQVNHVLMKIFKAASIVTSVKVGGRKHLTPEATFHSLRHSFVTFAANAGVPLHAIQSVVGHTSKIMTWHYYHESEDVLKKTIAAIPDFGS